MLYTWHGVSFAPGAEINLYEVGMQECPPGSVVKDYIAPYNIMHFVIGGRGRLLVGDKPFDVHKGEGFFSLQGTRMTYIADNDDPWYYVWIHFDGAKADEYLRSVGIWQSDPVFRIQDTGVLLERVRRMYVIATGTAALDEARIKAEVYALFATVLADNAGRRQVEIIGQNKYVEAVTQYLRTHMSDNITIESVARTIGLNAHYLTELFHNATGFTPQQYLISLRVQHACLLLQRTDMKIAEIAAQVGYDSSASFGKIFRKIRGVSPSEFRSDPGVMHVEFKRADSEYSAPQRKANRP